MVDRASAPSGGDEPPGVRVLFDMLVDLADLDGRPSAGDAADSLRLRQLGLLEQVKAAAGAAQARITREFAASQRALQEAQGHRRDQLGRGIGDQVALACGLPPSQGSRRLGFARALVEEMRHTHVLLTGGEISEWMATLLVRETACLTREDRAAVDERLCSPRVDEAGSLIDPPVLTMTPKRAVNAARAIAAELDAAAMARRAAYAETERRVWLRPAPDAMAWVTALLPVAQAVACYASLKQAADRTHGHGLEQRSHGQLMADLFVERLTGQQTATAVPIEIALVMTPDTLLGTSDRPARLSDGTPLPAQTARELAQQPDAPRWLRRIFTDPVTGVVTDADRARRRFYGGQERRVLTWRDQHCRHPWCDAPVEHRDHVRRVADEGPTTVANGQGTCRSHNRLKELPGWSAWVSDPRPGRHEVSLRTPTGSVHTSQAPPALPP